MALRDPKAERDEAAETLRKIRETERQRMADLAQAVLSSKDGKELFGYLVRRFHLHGRCFLSTDARSPVCPYAAATRDGEKTVLWHLLELAREANPEFPIP
jgi:hypothetical protein